MTPLRSIDLPATLTSIGSEAFYQCGLLTTVTSRNPTPPSLNPTAFSTASSRLFYVPDANVNAYKGAAGWSAHADRIKPLSEKP
jgi:hypothetical protein